MVGAAATCGENGAGRWATHSTFRGYGLFNVLAPVMHGSFFQWALLLKAAQREADRPGNEIATDRAVEKVYLFAFAGLISASVAEGVSIARGKSRFARLVGATAHPARAHDRGHRGDGERHGTTPRVAFAAGRRLQPRRGHRIHRRGFPFPKTQVTPRGLRTR